jgi:hypothetical protein
MRSGNPGLLDAYLPQVLNILAVKLDYVIGWI